MDWQDGFAVIAMIIRLGIVGWGYSKDMSVTLVLPGQ